MKQTYEGRHTTSRKKLIDQKESLMYTQQIHLGGGKSAAFWGN